jgi:hypothetical protein
MLALALTLAFAPQVAPQPSLRALIEAAPRSPEGEVLVDVLLDGSGRAQALVVRDAQGRESLREWSALVGREGAWRIDVPLAGAMPSPALLEPAPEPTDRADYRALFAQSAPQALAGVVQSIEHGRAHDGREFVSLRVQVQEGDLVRVALGPSGWHARGLGLPEIGERAHLRAVATRDERGLLWVAAGLRLGESPELRVRGDDGAPRWQECGVGPVDCSARALLGRRVREGDETAGRVADLLLERGTGAPRTTFVILRGAGGGPSVPLAWERASFADDGSLNVAVGALEGASGAVRLQTSRSCSVPTRDGPRSPGPEAACCLRPTRAGRRAR